jgi:hypothetical protein
MRSLLALLTAILVLGCPSVPAPVTPPSPPDASDASAEASPAPPPSTCVQACAALRSAGCPLGVRADCPSFLVTMTATGEVANASTQKPLSCSDVAAVTTAAQAKAIGFGCSDAGLGP